MPIVTDFRQTQDKALAAEKRGDVAYAELYRGLANAIRDVMTMKELREVYRLDSIPAGLTTSDGLARARGKEES